MRKGLLRLLYGLRAMLQFFMRYEEAAVLCFHSIGPASTHDTALRAEQLERHLGQLKNAGVSFVGLGDVVARLDGKKISPRHAVALTFDDGYADFVSVALPILKKHAAPATVFITPSPREAWDAPLMSEADLVALRDEPLIEIGWHTATHPDLSRISKEELAAEITPPVPMRFFAYPGGNRSHEAVDAVRGAGFSAAFTIKRDLVRHQDRWRLPRIVVTRDDTSADVLMYTSVAQQWYAALTRVFKRYAA